ncbi:MAG: UvrB/UvrC motif-containing protein [Planctomycetota bacterium]
MHPVDIKVGEKQEVHLCERCAIERGLPGHKTTPYSMHELVNTLLEKNLQQRGTKTSTKPGQKCPDCGMTYQEFRTKGRFGCANDYNVFKDGIVPLLEKIHGSSQYIGKVPHKVGIERSYELELLMLRQKLQSVVKNEEYEEAARLRDRIQTLEKKLQEQQRG